MGWGARAGGECRRQRGAAAPARPQRTRSPPDVTADRRPGKVVAPGSSTSTATAAWCARRPRHEPKVRQGVTTEIIGVDGTVRAFAAAPRPRGVHRAGLGPGRPAGHRPRLGLGRELPRPLRRDGDRQYRDTGRKLGAAHRRAWVGGRPGRRAGPRRMRASSATRWRTAHSAFIGLDYPPGAYATTDELAALTAEAAPGGLYHTHVRYPLGDRYLDPFREAIEIGRRAGAPAPHPLLPPRDPPGPAEPLLALVDDARAEGLDVTFDTYHPSGRTRRCSSSSALGPGGRPGAAKGGGWPTGRRGTECGTELAAARRGLHGCRRAGPTSASGPSATPTTSVGVADARRRHGRNRPRRHRHHLRSAAREGLGVRPSRWPSSHRCRLFVAHPVGMVGTD